jgi:hypothetical protein
MDDRDRFDKFTERARKVLKLAQEEAQRLHHNYIGTEHLLLGMVHEGEGVAAHVLTALDIDLPKVRNAVSFIIGRGDRIVLGEIGLTPRAKKVIELAVDEARRLNHNYIGTEHILLGVIREGEGVAAGVLASLGVDLETVRITTIQVLSGQKITASRGSNKNLTFYVAMRGSEAIAAVGAEIDKQMAVAFGRQRVFCDTMAVPMGWDWRAYLRQQVTTCTAVLLIIGPDWAQGDVAPPRVLDGNDPAYIAVETALQHQKRIVPILVQGATLPSADSLPPALRDLAYYQGAAIRPDSSAEEDIAALIVDLLQTDWA